MCGICGIVSSRLIDPSEESIHTSMRQSLMHRGPDDEGYYSDSQALLGIRRLSIIDLDTGHQPIPNEDRTIWLVFNGEIYNFQSIRTELRKKGHHFTTKTDSEVIIHAYEEYGDRCVERFTGMFAFAIWDTKRKRLLLARDQIGIKPLYYWVDHKKIIFGSELQSVVKHPEVPQEIDLISLDLFLTLEYIPGPRTIYKEVKKLLPGHFLVFSEGQSSIQQYWDIPLEQNGSYKSKNEYAEILYDLIKESVRMQLISDVPLGAFLSGGIDSSAIVSMMSQISSEPVQTFSIGFNEGSYNELPYARLVATQFNSIHSEEVLKPDISQLIEQLIFSLDEPLADTSIIPTFLVSKLARQSVKVVLSGDGGDELFGGYDTYLAQKIDRYYRFLPERVRNKTLPALVNLIPPQPAKKGIINKTKRLIEGAALSPELYHMRWMMFLTQEDKLNLYKPEIRASINGCTPADFIIDKFKAAGERDALARQQYVDIKTYLVDDILMKVDRMSMAVSLETRVPLLDHRIVEFAVNLPSSMKISFGRTKLLFREAMSKHLPEEILLKPKQGFSIPMKNWLRGPLLPVMREVLSSDSLRNRGLFEEIQVSNWVNEHLSGKENHSHRLWSIMVLELWMRKMNTATIHYK
jgi:asparagine synthase (glutamine-hydrolysing)